MPLYECKCNKCGKTAEVFRSVSEYNNMPKCCGIDMGRVLSAPAVLGDQIKPYVSQANGQMITSRSQHKQHLRQRGLVEIGDQHHAQVRHIEQTKKAAEKKEKIALRQEVAARLDSVKR